MSLREQILKADDFKYKVIEVPEWDTRLRIRTLSVGDAIKMMGEKETIKQAVETLIAAVVDEKGDAVFTPADQEALSKKDFKVVMRIFNEINALHEFKIPEQAEKN